MLIRVRSSQFITDMTTELMTHFNLSVEGVKVTEDLDIEVYQNGSVKDLQQLSGGERTAVAIALRMAMAKYLLSSISVMLMDEPTNFHGRKIPETIDNIAYCLFFIHCWYNHTQRIFFQFSSILRYILA